MSTSPFLSAAIAASLLSIHATLYVSTVYCPNGLETCGVPVVWVLLQRCNVRCEVIVVEDVWPCAYGACCSVSSATTILRLIPSVGVRLGCGAVVTAVNLVGWNLF